MSDFKEMYLKENMTDYLDNYMSAPYAGWLSRNKLYFMFNVHSIKQTHGICYNRNETQRLCSVQESSNKTTHVLWLTDCLSRTGIELEMTINEHEIYF